MHLSAKIPVNMVMVAGPYASGKTTLMVMMYHLFREGLNKKLRFRGSKTMLGYWERSEKLMQYSANERPEVDRTSLQIVCTKMDSIKEVEDIEKCKEYVKKVFDEIEKNYGDKVRNLSMHFVSALELDKEGECRHLESILENCVSQRSAQVERTAEISSV